MKLKLFAFLLFALATGLAHGQDFKKFKVGIGLGYAMPAGGGDGAKGGVIFYAEPAYRLKDNIAVGLRLEGALTGRVAVSGQSSSNSSAKVDIAATGSYTANIQYYFMNNSFRPFAGAGFGIYSMAAGSASSDSQGNTTQTTSGGASTKIGFYPRVGFDAGHFTMQIEYNIVPNTTTKALITNTQTQTVTTADLTTKNSYLGIKFGWFFGGGKKK